MTMQTCEKCQEPALFLELAKKCIFSFTKHLNPMSIRIILSGYKTITSNLVNFDKID